ncbi:hypothetical protein CC80DRAFT_526230 [Byssothecium circinans]|uniref:Fungal-type protein kinase domain-containing protein n=1 Tax=Byssothecium circinans TaxID=147558 RepID=A0A6A5TY85_9PLEO|nr:hypothetical protein CC80DRAFT_526230 [Byssothecium circinans]
MADESRSKVIKANPISKGLNTFRDSFKFKCRGLAITGADALYHISGEELNLAVNSSNFNIERIIPLLRANNIYAAITTSTAFTVAKPITPPLSAPSLTASFQQTPWLHNTGSFANSTEHHKYVDGVLKEELGQLYVDVPSFFKAYFGSVPDLKSVAQAVFNKCKEGDNPLYQQEISWQGWPEGARERDLLGFAAAEHQPAAQSQRRPLAQPHQPIQGSTANRKLDSQILIPGELKSNPLADTASKAWLDLGRYAREVLAAQDSRCFVLGFTLYGSLMRLLQFVSAVLGFDPTIITAGDKRYIKIERDNHAERLIIDKVMKRVPYEEGELLREATNKGVDDDIRVNVCTGAPLPPMKRTYSSSPTKGKRPAFLINLDLAIKEQQEKSLGARGKTGTRAFMAIGVLLDNEMHSFMHDLESFFWNYESDWKLAKLKFSTIGDERDFVRTLLIPCVNRLRRKVFPNGGRWRDPNLKLYFKMKQILQTARDELKELKG